MYKVLPIHSESSLPSISIHLLDIAFCHLCCFDLSHSLHLTVISRKTEVFISNFFLFLTDFNILLFKENIKIFYFPKVLMFTNK